MTIPFIQIACERRSYVLTLTRAILLTIGFMWLHTLVQAQTITTVAGSNVVGDGGPAIAANIQPIGVVVDGSGNIFIADEQHHRIRKIATNGTIMTVAGTGTFGFSGDGGPATQATLSSPVAVKVDGAGNLYIADKGNGRIRKVATDGTIMTVAGGGTLTVGGGGFPTFGSPIGDYGPATEALLSLPSGIAIDGSGNLYIADTGNHLIRKVDTNGTITTVAGKYNNPPTGGFNGDGDPAVWASLNWPSDVVVDANGRLFIADQGNGRIRKVDEFGNISTIAGGNFSGNVGDGGLATDASIYPYAMVLDGSGNLYFTDGGSRIRKIDNTGIITTVVGNRTFGFSGDGGPATDALIHSDGGIAIDNGGNLVFADQYNYRVRKISTAGTISTIGGNGYFSFLGDGGPATSANLYAPRGVAVDASGVIYISDSQNRRIRRVATSGVITTIAGNGTSGFGGDGGPAAVADLNFPAGLAVAANGSLYFVDAGNHRIRKIAPDGTISTVAGNGTAGFSGDGGAATAASLNFPEGIAIDGTENLFIADAGNNRIRKVTAGGIISTVAGTGMAGFSGDGGPAVSAKFLVPSSIAVDGTGNVYISDRGNYRVRKIATDGTISTVAGNGTSYYLGDGGQATTVGFTYLSGIALDATGNLLLVDGGSYAIRKVAANGIISTITGNGTNEFSGDGGPASEAGLASPSAPVVSNNGALFFADNNRIRKITGLVSLPTVSLGASPAICNGASSFVLTYTATSGSPNQYTISGAGVVAGKTGALTATSGTLTVGINSVTFGGSFSIVVANTATGLIATPLAGTVVINMPPAITVSRSASLICAGQSVTLTASGCTGMVSWNTGATGSSLVVTPAAGTYAYSANCLVNSCTGPASQPVSVTVNAMPIAPTLTANTSGLCAGQDVILTASGCSGTISWNTGATTTSINVRPPTPTSYTATCSVNACPTTSSSISVAIGLAPTITPATTDLCSGRLITLNATGIPANPLLQWQLNGASIAGATGTSYTTTQAGTYTLFAQEQSGNAWRSLSKSNGSQFSVDNLYTVKFTDASVGWIRGNYGIYRTTNAGQTWSSIASQPGADGYFLSNTTGWVVGGNGSIKKTTDGGASWQTQTSNTPLDLYGVYFLDANTGYAVGGRYSYNRRSCGWVSGCSYYYDSYQTILKTTNGGASWATVYTNNLLNSTSAKDITLSSVFFQDANNGWAGGNAGKLYRTANGGATWTAQTTTFPNSYESVKKIVFTSTNNGWALSNYGNLIKTTNGGSTWAAAPGISSGVTSLYFLTAATGWLTSYYNIYQTVDGGTTWINQSTSGSGLTDIQFTSPASGWAVGASGTLLNYGAVYINGCLSNSIAVKTSPLAPTLTSSVTNTICAGGLVTLSATGCSGTMIWTGGLSGTSITVSPITTQGYRATCQSANGCSGDSSAVATVTVKPIPTSPAISSTTCTNNLLKLWDRRFGGDSNDILLTAFQTADGGYLLGGASASGQTGDKSESLRGTIDYWVVRVDATGNKLWDKRFGGDEWDELKALISTADGGYLLGGSSTSGQTGDKSQPSRGSFDYWIVKINASGDKVWDKRFGGDAYDDLQSLVATPDGGYLLGGLSTSGPNGDKSTVPQGDGDYWLVKIDANGTKLWDKQYGGDSFDEFRSLLATNDGGYLLAGTTQSGQTGDKSQPAQGEKDYWVVRIDAAGTKLWDKRFGGTRDDDLFAALPTADGGFVLGGGSLSGQTGDKSQPTRGSTDFWVVKIDANGTKRWDKRFGGTSDELLNTMVTTPEGGFLLGGYAHSGQEGDKSQPSQGETDYWVVRTDPNGNKLWDERFGGTDGDNLRAIVPTTDGDYLLAGFTASAQSGDITQQARGGYDYWVIKTKRCQGGLTLCAGQSVSLTASGCTGRVDWNTGAISSSIVVSTAGTYTATCTTNGCVSPSSNQIMVTVSPAPSITVTGNLMICAGVATTLTASGGTSFSWSTGATTASVSVTATGTYSVTVTNAGGCSSSTGVTVSTHPDYAVLADLYTATNGVRWTNKTKWLTNCDPCSGWYRVTCTAGRVTGISLFSNNLVGTIPASLSMLTNLTDLALNANSLSGGIPASLSALANLQYLNLSNNELTGSIPASLSTLNRVESLGLDRNQLSGSIPGSLSALRGLKYLSLFSNQLTGTIPTSLSALSSLERINLSTNLLTGTIPGNLSALSHLQVLDLSNNKLAGSIPAILSQLSNMSYLALKGNQLSGTIPISFTALTNLGTLNLSFNQLTGTIPNLHSYQELDLSGNQLTGPVPTNLPTLSTLRTLRLNNNLLSGSIPESFSALNEVEFLNLSSNQLSGCFPASLSIICGKVSPFFNINFSNNPALPNNGDLFGFCATGAGACITETIPTSPTLAVSQSIVCRQETLSIPISISVGCPTVTTIVSLTSLPTVGVQSYSFTCTNTAGTSPATVVSLTVVAVPIASISGTLRIYAGQSTTLVASGGTGYRWSTGAVTASVSVSLAGVYSVTVQNGTGCSSTTSVLVTVNPVASISGNLTVCPGQSTILTVLGGSTAVWSTGATTTSISVSITGTYSATITDVGGATSSASVVVTVLAAPSVNIGTNQNSCAGQSTTLTAVGCAGTVTWSTGITGNALVVSPPVSTTYSASCIQSGCPAAPGNQISLTILTAMFTVKTGSWNDASVWSCGRVPVGTDTVTLNHAIQVPGNYTGRVRKLIYATTGRLLFSAGGQLKVGE